jgi:calnexin
MRRITLLLLSCAAVVSAQDPASEEKEVFSVPETSEAVFLETFQDEDPFVQGAWVKSTSEKHKAQEITITAGSLPGIYKDDKGLVLAKQAQNYAVAAKLPSVVDLKDNKDFVVQYEVRLQEGLDCGGAYLKLLQDDSDLNLSALKDDTPYTIMFGPDKCGTTNKVHFIFRHQNPVSKEWEEKHLKDPPMPKTDKKVHLYTLVVRNDNSFEIFIDQTSVKKGSLFADFDPPVNPPKQIDDPTDKKPDDWVDEKKIDDPEASKPEDWDEEAPMMIDDMDATKPTDWDDDAPLMIPDPAAKKPDDWDDEEDGDFEAPQIANPKCTSGHCGEWKRPEKKNPQYKGKWICPKIDNPEYKGEWAPKQIENPNFFEDEAPHKMASIAAVAIEVWTMSKGMQFDNFYIGHDEAAAKAFGESTWAKKFATEEANDADLKKQKSRQERESKRAEGGIANLVEVYLLDFLDVVSDNLAISLGLFALLIVGLVFLCGGSSGTEEADEFPVPAEQDAAAAKKKDDDVEMEEEEKVEEEEEEEEEDQEEEPKLRKRTTKTARAD